MRTRSAATKDDMHAPPARALTKGRSHILGRERGTIPARGPAIITSPHPDCWVWGCDLLSREGGVNKGSTRFYTYFSIAWYYSLNLELIGGYGSAWGSTCHP